MLVVVSWVFSMNNKQVLNKLFKYEKTTLTLIHYTAIYFFTTRNQREYYTSGKLLSIINYNDGVREGSCKYFYIMEHGRYCQNQIIKRVS